MTHFCESCGLRVDEPGKCEGCGGPAAEPTKAPKASEHPPAHPKSDSAHAEHKSAGHAPRKA